MKQKSHSIAEALAPALPLLFAFLILGCILFFKPFWGLMDDENNRVLGSKMLSGNFFEIWNTNFWNDLYGNGRLRAWYWPMIASLYGISGTNSLITYFLNALFVFAILFLLAKAMARVLEELFPSTYRWNFYFFLLFSIAYPWTNHLFISPSLQEKLVLLGGALVIFSLPRLDKFKSNLLWFLAWIALLAIACNAKEQIVLFFPILVGFQYQVSKGKLLRPLLLLFLLCISLGIIYWVGTWGGYKGRYGIEGLKHTIEHSRSLWIFLGASIVSLLASIAYYLKIRELPRFFLASTFGISLIGFLTILAPWGLGHYLNTSALPFCFLCFVFVTRTWLPSQFLTPVNYFVGFILSFASFAITFVPAFSAYGDLRVLLESEQLRAVSSEALFMPAEEGRESFVRFAKWKSDLDLKINQGSEFTQEQALEKGGVWIVSPLRANNPIDFEKLLVEGKVERIFKGRLASGFHLYRIRVL